MDVVVQEIAVDDPPRSINTALKARNSRREAERNTQATGVFWYLWARFRILVHFRARRVKIHLDRL
jgi:hypothetical protein